MSFLSSRAPRILGVLLIFALTGETQAQTPTVTVDASDPSAAELGLDPGEFTFARSGGDLGSPLSVSYGLTDSTATSGTDYVAISSPFTIPAGESSATLTIAPLADNRAEGSESVLLTVAPSSAYVIGGSGSATVTIADDPAVVGITASDSEASEQGLDPGEFTFARSGGDRSVVLNVSFSLTGSTAFSGQDYSAVSSPIAIPADADSVTLTITPLADNQAEGAETVVITLAASSEYVVGTDASATVNIADDAATITVEASDADAAELGPDPGEFRFLRTGGDLSASLSVGFSLTGSTATSGTDFATISSPIVFASNEATAVLAVTPLADNTPEPIETVVVTIASSSSYLVGVPGSATVNIAEVPDLMFADSFETNRAAKRCALSIDVLSSNQTNLIEVGDGTVLDLATGLQWTMCWLGQEVDPAKSGCTGSPIRRYDASAVEGLGLAGYFDWRQPNQDEVQELLAKTCGLSNTSRIPPRLVRTY